MSRQNQMRAAAKLQHWMQGDTIEADICLHRGSWEGHWTSNRHREQKPSYKGLIQEAGWYEICSATGETCFLGACWRQEGWRTLGFRSYTRSNPVSFLKETNSKGMYLLWVRILGFSNKQWYSKYAKQIGFGSTGHLGGKWLVENAQGSFQWGIINLQHMDGAIHLKITVFSFT